MLRHAPSERVSPGAFVAALLLALLLPSAGLFAQSGRHKPQPAPGSKPAAPSTTRPKRASTGNNTPRESPAPAPSPAATVQSGTVLIDEPPPPAPALPKKADPNPPQTGAGEEVGEEDVVRINSNLVTVPASVIDAQGRAVTDLKLEDFELRVDGQPRAISEISFSDTPVRIVMLFDNSMSLIAGREFEKHAAVNFFRRVLRPIDQAAIYSIYTYPILILPFTNDVQTLVRTIERFGKPEDGTTSLFDTIAEAAEYLRPFPGRKVIVIVSDGADTTSNLDFDTTLRRAQSADCQIYSVQTGQFQGNANLYDLTAQRRLQSFSEQTGGALYIPQGTADIEKAFAQIATDLSQQYVLSYYPSEDQRDGRFRTISLRVTTRPNMRVRARRGYYPRRPGQRLSFNALPPAASDPAGGADKSAQIAGFIPQATAPSRADSAPALASNAALRSSAAPVRPRQAGPSDIETESLNVSDTVTGAKEEKENPKAEQPKPAEPVARTGEKPGTTSEPPASQPPATRTPSPPAPGTRATPTPQPTPPAQKATVSGGVLNARAVNLPKPQYPLPARTARVSGIVTVEVLLDENGKVTAARAVDGPPLLRQAAVEAARQAEFTATMLSGQPVKVIGVIKYSFNLAP
jgi:Ca-activated chloride channel family protein